jgi:hypothetical protein
MLNVYLYKFIAIQNKTGIAGISCDQCFKGKFVSWETSCCMHVHSPTLNIILGNSLRDKIPEKHNKIKGPDFIFSSVICFLTSCNRITTKFAVSELNSLRFNLITTTL